MQPKTYFSGRKYSHNMIIKASLINQSGGKDKYMYMYTVWIRPPQKEEKECKGMILQTKE